MKQQNRSSLLRLGLLSLASLVLFTSPSKDVIAQQSDPEVAQNEAPEMVAAG